MYILNILKKLCKIFTKYIVPCYKFIQKNLLYFFKLLEMACIIISLMFLTSNILLHNDDDIRMIGKMII